MQFNFFTRNTNIGFDRDIIMQPLSSSARLYRSGYTDIFQKPTVLEVLERCLSLTRQGKNIESELSYTLELMKGLIK